MADTALFFIVGAGRSGTTLLRLILTGHTRLHIPPETWFLRDLVRDCPLAGALTQAQVERAVSLMVRHERWPDLAMPEALLRTQAAALTDPSLADVVGLVHRHLLQSAGKQRFGDKTPHYFAIVPALATMYPDAKFMYLVRDGHDVAISWVDAGWQRHYEPGFEWPAAMAALRRDRAALPGRVLTIRYEDLVQSPIPTMRQVCGFLGETFEPAMLDWGSRTHAIAERDRHLHGRLQEPLTRESVGAWRRRLTTLECFGIEACLHRELRDAGYDVRFQSPAWRPLLCIAALMLHAAAPVLRRAVPWLQRSGLVRRRLYL
jgi:hypothetical protein